MGLKTIVYIGLVSLLYKLNAQDKNFQEEVHLSLNTTNILVGETLHFSAFIYSNESKRMSNLSSVLYIELIDKGGRSMFQTKIGLRGGRGAGSIYIRPEWMTDTYRIIAYTRWMKNYESYFEQKVLIFNPYNGVIINDTISGNPHKWQEHLARDTETYKPIENVTIDLGSIEPAKLAIGVRRATNLYYPNEVKLKNQRVDIDSYQILPEYRYAVIQGKIIKESGDPGQIRINMIIKGSSLQLATTKTDEFGRFCMNYNPDYLIRDGMVQIEVKDETAKSISLIDEYYDHYPMLSDYFTLDSAIIPELIDRSVFSQIERAYEIIPSIEPARQTNYTHPQALVLFLDEYTRFSSTRDTFIELTSNVSVSKNENNYSLTVRCKHLPNIISEKPESLLLLDGFKTTAENILNQSPNNIEKIEILPQYYFVNDIVYGGIISVHSFTSKKFEYTPSGQTFSLGDYQSYSESDYKLEIEENLPLYDFNLLWKPIYTHEGGTLRLNLTTSRLEGNYLISVTGITQSGTPINLLQYFQISSN
ncbi:hypothetical protein AAOE16_16280 [Ekhidna sp. MALMAid0563]